jgi:hypothetical protein
LDVWNVVLYNNNEPTDGSPFSALTKLLKTKINISLAGHCKESTSTFQIVQQCINTKNLVQVQFT